ncbi:MAG: hypothetical protein WKF68_12460 [Daejeonella sp.]
MKKYFLLLWLAVFAGSVFPQANSLYVEESLKPIFPGQPGIRPFWNQYALRFIYAPVFDFPKVRGATSYRFKITDVNKKVWSFKSDNPWAVLTPIWNNIPEGYTELQVDGLDKLGNVTGLSGKRIFYRVPVFGKAENPVKPFMESVREGLKALFNAPNVQYWLSHAKPDPSYRLYCYPNKVIGGLVRAMAAYSKIAENQKDRDSALKIAKLSADYLLSVRRPSASRYAYVPPTYLVNVTDPYPQATERTKDNWLMVPSAIDAAFGFLDMYDATKENKYLDAAKNIAQTLTANQESDGTWPLMVNSETGKSVHAQRLIPTWIIFFFDRLDNQYKLEEYRTARGRAWDWIVANPLKTYQWNGQFEDVKLHGPYVNLAREQACDVATLLLNNSQNNPENIAQADELLRFAEDQFVVWTAVKDPDGWRKAMPNRLKTPDLWIAPCVLEQFACYEPVARSSAILINAYLTAHQITNKPLYLEKAKALTNGLVAGQSWVEKKYGGTVEIPTWVMRRKPSNWLNNSYYAAQAILNMANYGSK